MVVTQGRRPVPETVERLEAAIAARGLTLFARIDHAAAARAAGLELPDEVVLVFGDPRAGTPLMREAPAVGIELPQRILVWDEDGRTRIGFRDPTSLAAEYGIEAQRETLERMHVLLDGLAAEAEGDGTEAGPEA
jgi:uncharacterized protein (DUF302 family)